jgi:hypothetical protein
MHTFQHTSTVPMYGHAIVDFAVQVQSSMVLNLLPAARTSKGIGGGIICNRKTSRGEGFQCE